MVCLDLVQESSDLAVLEMGLSLLKPTAISPLQVSFACSYSSPKFVSDNVGILEDLIY